MRFLAFPFPDRKECMLANGSRPCGWSSRRAHSTSTGRPRITIGARIMTTGYVHGYNSQEARRLRDQAATLDELLHSDTRYPNGCTVLEAGCGVGAQTLTLARNSPGAQIVSIDVSSASLAVASERVRLAGIANVRFERADINDLPFAPESFDHVFVCFVLEHLPRPTEALTKLERALKPGGSVTVIEGDHGSTYFHPDNPASRLAIRALVELQRLNGGNANIGRSLYPLLAEAGFGDVHVSPRMVYVDASRPQLVDGFTRRTFTAMIEGVRDQVIAAGLLTQEDFEKGVEGLRRVADSDGVFCYTFFKATACRRSISKT
jgi:SAM-dependent methyltransferase